MRKKTTRLNATTMRESIDITHEFRYMGWWDIDSFYRNLDSIKSLVAQTVADNKELANPQSVYGYGKWIL